MTDINPLERKRAIESWLRVADQQLAKLREIRYFEGIWHNDLKDSTRRDTLHIQPSHDALRAFLIVDLERQIALRQNELRRTRFEAAQYLRDQLANLDAEIGSAARRYFDGDT